MAFSWFGPKTTVAFLIAALVLNIIMQFISITPEGVTAKVDFSDASTYLGMFGLFCVVAIAYRLGEFRGTPPKFLQKYNLMSNKPLYKTFGADTPPEIVKNVVTFVKWVLNFPKLVARELRGK